MNIQDKLPLLERLARYINPVQYTVVTAFNPTKAQILRDQANELDQKEADWVELTEVIKQIRDEQNTPKTI